MGIKSEPHGQKQGPAFRCGACGDDTGGWDRVLDASARYISGLYKTCNQIISQGGGKETVWEMQTMKEP